MMSRRRSTVASSTSSQKIRDAVKNLRQMPMEERIDLMVQAKVMTREQAERAKKKWAETRAAE
jgi:hypothetical protein